jgi:hypothetical protein
MVTSVPPARTRAADRPRTSPPITSNTHVDLAGIVQLIGLQVHEGIGTQAERGVLVGGPPGADHPGSRPARELHRDRADRSTFPAGQALQG